MMAKNTAKKVAVAYCRVSTKGQVGEDKYGLETQRKEIEEYSEKNGIEVVRWYVDEAVSGVKGVEERPELLKVLNGGISNPPIQMLIVAKSDRLSRDVAQYYWFKYTFGKMGIEIVSVREDFGASGNLAVMYEALIAVFAEMERNMIKSRMSGGREVKALKGGYSGGKAPYGYDSARGSGKLTVNVKEAKIVREIFRLRDEEGKTLKDVCQIINLAGGRNRSGGEFTTSSVQYILGNRRTYEGCYRYGIGGDWVKGEHEAILKSVE